LRRRTRRLLREPVLGLLEEDGVVGESGSDELKKSTTGDSLLLWLFALLLVEHEKAERGFPTEKACTRLLLLLLTSSTSSILMVKVMVV